MKIHKYSEATNKELFIQVFSHVHVSLYAHSSRPVTSPQYFEQVLKVFHHVEKELFLIEENGEYIARLCLNSTQHDSSIAFLGMLEYPESRQDLCFALLNQAKNWCIERAKTKIFGPIDLNIWMNNRFSLEEHNTKFSWEPHNPINYVEDCLRFGFKMDQGYLSCLYNDSHESLERTKDAYAKVIAQGYSFRQLDLKHPKEIDTLYNLNTASFSENYLYEDISRLEYEQTHIHFLKNTDLRYSFFILDQFHRELGYIFSFLDKGHLIIKSLLLLPEARGSRVSSALLHHSVLRGVADGITRAGGALVRKGNISEYFFKNIGTAYETHHYSLLCYTL